MVLLEKRSDLGTPERDERCIFAPKLREAFSDGSQEALRLVNFIVADVAISQERLMDDTHRIGIVPGSDTGAFEMAMWTMLGARGVITLAWESFGEGWVYTDRWDLPRAEVEKQMKGYVLHHGTAGSVDDVIDSILHGGGDFTCTTERLRKGIPISAGMSPTSSKNRTNPDGGSNA